MRRPPAAITWFARLVIPLALLGAAAPVSAAPIPAPPPHIAPPLFQLGPSKPPPSLVFAYHGFQVDASGARRQQSPDKTVRMIKAQIDLVEQVGLKPEVITYLRTVPVLADPAKDTGKAIESSRYLRGRGVMLKVKRLNAKKPILLSGLLQAYQDQKLPGGLANPEITRFRNEAAARRVWPKTALMLQSDADYFALTGAVYLYGAITREPYTRANLRQSQPQYYRWLADLFDDGHARV
ncbi:MAG: hypothetical protein P4L64_13425 [Caulobacteraceae bacterium]|nr:hypothetical protein [Caulobacteraceae bacterium]